jgi:broad specificity phosphatase PhoE
MTRFYLLRHAVIDGLGKKITGRMSGVALNASGRDQAARLARRLERHAIDALYTSPQRRTIETAEAVAQELGLKIEIAGELDEIDFGDWTGKTYDELGGLDEWRAFNALHSATRIPNGELLLEAQTRVIALMGRLCDRHPEKTVALVSHGDVIRVALAHQLGIPIDFIMRFEVGPASISAVELNAHGPRVLWINSCAETI